MASSMIASKLSALSFWHLMYFKQDPTSNFMVRRVLAGMKKARPGGSLRPPLSFTDLKAFKNTLQQISWTPYKRSLIWSMILLSFHAFLRAGEMTKSENTLMFHQVVISDSHLIIKVDKFKFSRGRSVSVKVIRQRGPLCPVSALKEFIGFRGSLQGYLFCQADGSPVTYAWYRKHFNELVGLSDCDPELSTHSARIGAATFAAASGIPKERIQRMGRWVSSAVKKYIKLPVLSFE